MSVRVQPGRAAYALRAGKLVRIDVVDGVPQQPVVAPPAYAAAAGMTALLFSDDFTGTALDAQKWTATGTGSTLDGPDGGSNDGGNQELQWYEQARVTVSGGTAKLTTVADPKVVPDRWLNSGFWDPSYLPVDSSGRRYFPYRSGAINTKGKFATPRTNYAVEYRIRYDAHVGSWVAAWTLPAESPGWPVGGENDVLEQPGARPFWGDYTDAVRAFRNLHWVDAQGNHRDEPGEFRSAGEGDPNYDGPVLAGEWHTWAAVVAPTSVTYYMDGVQLGDPVVGAEKVPDRPHYLIANVAAGGLWPGPPDAAAIARMPWTAAELEHVRVWGLPATTGYPMTYPATYGG